MALTKVQIDGVEFSDSTDLNVDNGTLFVDSTNNRVGVGTTSPTFPLQVETTATGTTAGSNGVMLVQSKASGRDAHIRFGDNVNATARVGYLSNSLYAYVNSQERLRIDSSGRVGIGTSSPQAPFVVSNSGAEGIEMQGYRADFGTALVQYYNRSSSTFLDVTQRANSFRFNNSSAEVVRIDSSGRVGIGTSTAFGILTTASTGINLSSTTVDLGADGANGCIVSDTTSTNNTGVGYWFRHGGLKAGIASSRANTGNWGTDLRFYTHPTTVSDVNNVYERMRIDPAGNVGIGTTSPGAKLTITETSNANAIVIKNADSNGSILSFGINTAIPAAYIQSANEGTGTAQPLAFYNAAGEMGRFDTSGRLLVGTSSARGRYTLQLEGNSDSATDVGEVWMGRPLADGSISGGTGLGKVYFGGQSGGVGAKIEGIADAQWGTNDYPGRLVFSTTADGASSPTERMRIDNTGQIGIKTTSPGSNATPGIAFRPDGNTTNVPEAVSIGATSSNLFYTWSVYSSSLSQYQFYVGYAGTVYARSTSISALSDEREKENIVPLETGLTEILALQPRRFDWKNGSGQNIAGFIAQEVESVLPDLVDEYQINEDETRKALKMGDIIPTLVKAMQEQQAMIADLQTRLAALEAN